jgi:hypothetical protein
MLIDVLLPLDLVVLPLHLAMGKLPKNGKRNNTSLAPFKPAYIFKHCLQVFMLPT